MIYCNASIELAIGNLWVGVEKECSIKYKCGLKYESEIQEKIISTHLDISSKLAFNENTKCVR